MEFDKKKFYKSWKNNPQSLALNAERYEDLEPRQKP
jgi:hypothetical protein